MEKTRKNIVFQTLCVTINTMQSVFAHRKIYISKVIECRWMSHTSILNSSESESLNHEFFASHPLSCQISWHVLTCCDELLWSLDEPLTKCPPMNEIIQNGNWNQRCTLCWVQQQAIAKQFEVTSYQLYIRVKNHAATNDKNHLYLQLMLQSEKWIPLFVAAVSCLFASDLRMRATQRKKSKQEEENKSPSTNQRMKA